MRQSPIVLVGAMLAALIPGGGVAQAADARINIDNFSFSPARITVAPGTKITWANRDDIPHTVTDAANPKVFRSPPLDTDDQFSYVFAAPGTYNYFCSLHPHMQGTVVVK